MNAKLRTETGKTRKPKTQLIRMARTLAKMWANNKVDYGFLRDDALQLLKQAYKLGRKARP